MIIKSNNEGRVRGAVLYKAVAETLERLNVCVRAYYMYTCKSRRLLFISVVYLSH